MTDEIPEAIKDTALKAVAGDTDGVAGLDATQSEQLSSVDEPTESSLKAWKKARISTPKTDSNPGQSR